MNKNAQIDGRWDASRKLGNRNQYNPFSSSWKQYERAFGLQERVSESLDNAVENGYQMQKWCVEDIAIDMTQFDSFFENHDPKQLIPFIQDWKGAQSFLRTYHA